LKEKLIFRQATIEDCDDIYSLECKTWGNNAATKRKIFSRIKTFPEGSQIALLNTEVVGYICTVQISHQYAAQCKSWYDYTDDGSI
jgi:hypothetical protein